MDSLHFQIAYYFCTSEDNYVKYGFLNADRAVTHSRSDHQPGTLMNDSPVRSIQSG